MKILMVTSSSFKSGKTGDATQGRMTVSTFRDQGHDVTVVLASYCPLRFEAESGRKLSTDDLLSLADQHDVVHFLPVNPLLAKLVRAKTKTPVLGSSIFWGGWERVRVAWQSAKKIKLRLHGVLQALKPILGYKMDYRGVDVFLPNSNAEGVCVSRYFNVSKNSAFFPVSNGFVVPARDRLNALSRPEDVPEGDYIVVPGIFAPRKNQLALIDAMKGCDIPIVFLGGGYDSRPEYIERCKQNANSNMYFLGYVPSSSDKYWAVLKYARCACLPSDCETPGIAMLEAAFAGCRPIITKYGGTCEYYGFDAEYLNPCSRSSIRTAIENGWRRGRLLEQEADGYSRFTWDYCASLTLQAYRYAQEKGKVK